MDVNNRQTLEELSYRRLRLHADYRIINSNHLFGQGTMPYIKHDPYCRQLGALLANSDGGAILVTGFRGVGKSTMVHNAISRLNQKGFCRMIPIPIVLSAEKKYDQVLVEIIRQLYETLSQGSFWGELKIETQERIRLAYHRTMLDIKQSQELSVEGEFSIQIPLGSSPSANARSSSQQSKEQSYLAFSEQDAEYELAQCIIALEAARGQNKVVIIIDEIDKITATYEGLVSFDNLLERMKKLISSTNALFVFVAGIEIYQRWESDSQKINSLYDSLFGHHIYLPCIWEPAEDIFHVIKDKEHVYKPVDLMFRRLVQDDYTTILTLPFQMIENYILFKGKGLPRKMLRAFNDFVVWDNQQPCFLLTDSRIEAIVQISRLLEKFHKYMETKRHTTLFEQDICYSLFLFMLEFLLYQERPTFTEEQIRETILDSNDSLESYFKTALDGLLIEFENLSFIRRTETGFKIIDNTILNRDQSLRILDQDLLIRAQSGEQMLEKKYTSVDERFHNQIKLLQSEELNFFWNNYKADQVIVNTKDMMIFSVMERHSGSQKYAAIYKRKKQSEQKRGTGKAFGNLCSVDDYCFISPYFLDTKDYMDSHALVTSLRSAVEGYALEHLIGAKLKYLTIYHIARQILTMVEYLHNEGFGNIRLKPDNILLCKDNAIKMLDLHHLYQFDCGHIPCTTRIYSAPEVYLSKCSEASDYYSVGILLLEMLIGRSLSRHYAERHVDVNTVMVEIPCSKRLKDVLVKSTAFDPNLRYAQSRKFLEALDKCPEFRGMKKIPVPKNEDGIVSGWDIRASRRGISVGNHRLGNPERTGSQITTGFTQLPQNAEDMKSTDLEPGVNFEGTIFLDSAFFDDSDSQIQSSMESRYNTAYLVRQINNERIVLNKPAFRIGTGVDVDYRLNSKHISRIHAEFLCGAGKFYVNDYSTNGTFLNSKRIEPNKPCKIVQGDQIRIGNEEFVFYVC